MPDLWQVAQQLRHLQFVDLSHGFGPGIPKFPTDPDETRRDIPHLPQPGCLTTAFSLVGQWGTHVDAPAHAVVGGRRLDEIPVSEMILPLVVLDFTAQVAANADFTLGIADIYKWENRHGQIPKHAFVAFRSDWSKRWPDPELMSNKDANRIAHYPGWSPEAIEWLVAERQITAIGHETLDTDPGVLVSRDQFPAQLQILGLGRWQIERMTGLDLVPATGSLMIAAWPKPRLGTGFPVRAVAVLPMTV